MVATATCHTEQGLEQGLSGEIELATFYVSDFLLGVDIQRVQEINRTIDTTPVPHAPESVMGVINLRGEVVTVMDLRTILGVERKELDAETRNIVVYHGGEQIGLLVDQIADVVKTHADEIDSPPANLSGIEGRFFRGVYKMENELLVILDVDETLSTEKQA